MVIFEGHVAYYPYEIETHRWLQFSTLTIVIAFLAGLILAAMPITLSYCKLPRQVVIAGSCSAVMSAACHCMTSQTSWLLVAKESSDPKLGDDSQDKLVRLATGKLKWGVASSHEDSYDNVDGNGVSDARHPALGGPDQDVTETVEGNI